MKAQATRFLVVLAIMSLCTAAVFGTGGSEQEPEGVDWNETGLPIVNEPFTMSVVSAHEAETPSDHNDLMLFQELEERTGITIEWISFDYTAGDAAQRVQLLFSSGDLPDIVMNGMNRDVVYEYGQQGLIIPARELAEEYAPNIWKVVDEAPAFLQNSIAPDGNVYGWGKTPPAGADAMITHYINQQWLDNLGLEMPQTTDEFREVLIAFRDQDANGNGDPNDEIPHSTPWRGVRWWASDYGLMGAFGNPGNYGTPYLAMDDEGRPYYALATDTFKDFVSFMHGLVEDGLADPELYTQDWAALVAKGNAGILGSTASWVAEPAIVVGDNADQYVPVGPLTGPRGTQSYVYNGSRSADGGYAYAISSGMEYPEIAMRWINEMYDPLFSLQLNEGPIGVAIEIVNGNQIRSLPLAEGETRASRKNSTSLGGSAAFVWRDFYEWEPSPESAALSYIRELIEPALPVDNNWPALFLSQEEIEQVQGLQDEIRPLSERYWADWVMNGGVEEEWDEYIAQIERLGLQDYLDAYYEFKVARFGE